MTSPSPSGEAAVLAMAVGSILLVMCAVYVIFAIHKRRQRLGNPTRKPPGLSSTCLDSKNSLDNPTDFMNNLASWDRSHSIDDILEKRRKTAWTLEWFGNRNNRNTINKNPETVPPSHMVFQC